MGYIYEQLSWPSFTWDSGRILNSLTKAASSQGRLLGRMGQFGFELQQEAELHTLTEEITKSGEIEGETLNTAEVRSSIARRLNINLTETKYSHYIDGVVQMMIDATRNYNAELTEDRLFGWHAALFPTGRSGPYRINTAMYREDPMQVVSGGRQRPAGLCSGKEFVHYEAPSADKVSGMMAALLEWINARDNENPLVKAAVCHLWFVTIHPFDDGNGRIARALTDMLLARSENTPLRFYSMSSQIQKERKEYYLILEETQKGTLDITEWLDWFFNCLRRSIENSSAVIDKIAEKAYFWRDHAFDITDERQRKILNMLLDGFTGNLTTSKYAKIIGSSQDTAGRLLNDLVEKKILMMEGAGRSSHYVLIQTRKETP